MRCTHVEVTENLVDKTRTKPVPLQKQQSYNNCAIKKLGSTCWLGSGAEQTAAMSDCCTNDQIALKVNQCKYSRFRRSRSHF